MEGSLAAVFRTCLVPSIGHKFISADLASAEALVVGWLAGDPGYQRLAMIGAHRFALAKYLGWNVSLEMSDEDLKPIVKRAQKENPVLYKKIKTTLYGSQYLASAKTIYLQNPGEFETVAEAGKFQAFLASLSPKVEQWKKDIVRQATEQRYLQNPFGYYRAFWDPNDGPSMVNYLPQSIVAAVIKEIMVQLWDTEAGLYMVLQTHDSLDFDTPEDRIEPVTPIVYNHMTQPWPQLNGLAFDCSIEVKEDLR